jgi:Domain of unknown function (DUF4403)
MTKRIILVSLVLALASCTPPPKVQTKPELPLDISPAAAFAPVPSVIDVPLEMKSWYLEKLLNDQVTGLLYQCDTLTVAGMTPVKLKVWKGDSIKIGLEGNEISYRVPLKLWLQFQFTMGALGFSHTEYQEVEAALALKFRSHFSVKNDWKVVTETQSDGYEWITQPVLRVRFVSIPVTPLADIILLTQQNSLGAMVDSAVIGSLDLKKMLKPLWTRIQTPILLANAPDSLWLRLSPQSVYMTQLSGAAGTIRGSVGIRSVAETFLGNRPASNPIDTLPPFTVSDQIDTSFVINLYSEISYASATQMLVGALKGKDFTAGDNQVIVQDVSMYGMQGYAVVSIEFTGSFAGRVYVIGRVQYDRENSTVSIEDLEFDITTRNALHSAAGWLFHGIILDKVKPFLTFPLRERLLETQLLVQKMLSHKEIAKNLFVTGDIDSLALGGVTLTDNAIRAVVLARGKLSISAHD